MKIKDDFEMLTQVVEHIPGTSEEINRFVNDKRVDEQQLRDLLSDLTSEPDRLAERWANLSQGQIDEWKKHLQKVPRYRNRWKRHKRPPQLIETFFKSFQNRTVELCINRIRDYISDLMPLTPSWYHQLSEFKTEISDVFQIYRLAEQSSFSEVESPEVLDDEVLARIFTREIFESDEEKQAFLRFLAHCIYQAEERYMDERFLLFFPVAGGKSGGDVVQLAIDLSVQGNGTSENPEIIPKPERLFENLEETREHIKHVIQRTNIFLKEHFPKEAKAREFRKIRVSFKAEFEEKVRGKSLGLAVALVLIGRITLRGLDGVAATGQLDDNGNWGKVGSVKEKGLAIHKYNQKAQKDEPLIKKLVVYATKPQKIKIPESDRSKIDIISIDKWNDLRDLDNLIFEDTFGDYVSALQNDLPDFSLIKENDATWFRQLAQESYEDQFFPIPYDSHPQTVARFFAKECLQLRDKEGGIPVLLDVGKMDDTLLNSVQKSIHEIDPKPAGWDIRNTLFRANSFVLIFYADRNTNTKFFFGPNGILKQYKDGKGSASQRLVLIAPDYHEFVKWQQQLLDLRFPIVEQQI